MLLRFICSYFARLVGWIGLGVLVGVLDFGLVLLVSVSLV